MQLFYLSARTILIKALLITLMNTTLLITDFTLLTALNKKLVSLIVGGEAVLIIKVLVSIVVVPGQTEKCLNTLENFVNCKLDDWSVFTVSTFSG